MDISDRQRRAIVRRLAAGLLSVPAMAGAAYAQTAGGPTTPIRVVVPFPPGGPVDALTRIVMPRLSELLGQPVVIENRAGASGTIGTAFVAKAAPDGHTLIIGTTTTMTVTPRLYRNVPYDTQKDFTPLSRMASIPSVVLVHPSIPVTTVRQLIALARARPGMLTYGSAGAGTSQHLAVELFKFMAGVDLMHVPYKGGAQAMADLLGGHIAMTIEPVNTALPQVRDGKLKALAVTSPAPLPTLPGMPTVAQDLPGYEATLWVSLLGPAGLPPQVTNLLSSTLVRALQTPEVRDRMAQFGASPIGDTPAAFADTIRRESEVWSTLIRKIGLTLD